MEHFQKYLQVRLKVNDSISFIIYSSGLSPKEIKQEDCNGFVPFTANRQLPIILYSQKKESEIITLLETAEYNWKIEFEKQNIFSQRLTVTSSFSIDNKLWKTDREGLSGHLVSINYTGKAHIDIKHDNTYLKKIILEIIPAKLNYENEYKSMLEFIASHCHQLLLKAESPVSFNIMHSTRQEESVLLEKYFFLKFILNHEKLSLFLELIRQNPDNSLKSENNWKTFTHGISSNFYMNPTTNGRNWLKTTHDIGKFMKGKVPSEIISTSKRSTLDTPANRFLKYSLEYFLEICESVISYLSNEYAIEEAKEIRDELEYFLSLSFFKEVEQLRKIPFNSQVLQKREGYRDVYRAWLLFSMSSQLDWEGFRDIYKGSSKNIAVLYEYWLYFALHSILHNNKRYSLIKEESDFISEKRGGLSITLKTGVTAKCTFRTNYESNNLKIQLFYNRKFSGGDNGTVVDKKGQKKIFAEGSYTNDFRPDYTVALFPDNFTAIEDAGSMVSYVHFDAKYRVESYKDIHKSGAESENDEKNLSFKKDDINKMHIYNEAIRKTAGSYILYPGRDPAEKMNYKKYRELLPGVGAIAVKPAFDKKSGDPIISGAGAIEDFISQVVHFQRSRLTQNRRFSYYLESSVEYAPTTYNEAAHNMPLFDEPAMDNFIMLGYIRREDIGAVSEAETFFFHAVDRTGELRPVDPNIYKANYFIAFTDPEGETEQSEESNFTFLKEIWKIASPPTLVKKEEIEGIRPDKEPSVELYYTVQLAEAPGVPPFNKISLVQFAKLNTDVNQFSPKAVCWGDLLKNIGRH